MNTLVIPSSLARAIEALFADAPNESAGILFCREAHGPRGVKLLAIDFAAYEPEAYLERSDTRIVIDPVRVNEMIQRAKRQELSIVQVHTHPFSDDATFSDTDLHGEAEMLPVIARRVPRRTHGSLVLGRKTSTSRFYDRFMSSSQARIFTVGTSIHRIDGMEQLSLDERYSRSYLALGRSGQRALQGLRIGIVGLGGIGSLVAEQLAYLGVEDVTMIDLDSIEVSNLNRVVGAVADDVGRPKVVVAAERYSAVLPTATIKQIIGSVIDEPTCRSLIDCDMMFCCTDSHGSRSVLNWISYQYLLPMIDCGVEISVDAEGAVRAIAGRTQLVGPGMPCLHCCELLDANRVREDLLSQEEREKDEYIAGGRVAQPAVVTFNGVVASLATSMLLAIATQLPLRARMQIFNALSGQVRPAENAPKTDCPICSEESSILGEGDALRAIWRLAD